VRHWSAQASNEEGGSDRPKTEGMDSYQTIVGLGIVTSTYQPNYGTIFMRLKPWEERKDPKEK
jgi:hypothetical protein